MPVKEGTSYFPVPPLDIRDQLKYTTTTDDDPDTVPDSKDNTGTGTSMTSPEPKLSEKQWS